MHHISEKPSLSGRTLLKVLLVFIAGMAFLISQIHIDSSGRVSFGGQGKPKQFTPATEVETKAARQAIQSWMKGAIADPGARIIDPGILYRLPDGQGYMTTIRLERGEAGPGGKTVVQQWSLALHADGSVKQADLFRAPEEKTAIPMH